MAELWTSKKTGWILYPGIVVFLFVIVVMGNYIQVQPVINGTKQEQTVSLWTMLGQELIK